MNTQFMMYDVESTVTGERMAVDSVKD